MRTKINENTKVTLTIKQLKRLVKEAAADKSFLSPEEFLHWHDDVADPRKDRNRLDRIYDIIDRAHVDCDDVLAEYTMLSDEDKKKVTAIVQESALDGVKESEEDKIPLTASHLDHVRILRREHKKMMDERADDPAFQEMLALADTLTDADVCRDFGWENGLHDDRLKKFEAACWKHEEMIIKDPLHHTKYHTAENSRGTDDSYHCPCGFRYRVDSSD